MKLYELNQVYEEILNLDLEEDDLQLALESLEGTVKEKAENIGKLLNSLTAESDVYDNEIKRLQAKKKSVNSKYSGIKDYLAYSLENMHIEKLECELFKFSFRKSESVVIDDENLLPRNYVMEEIIHKIDKNAIKKAFKEGLVEGCHLEIKHNLQIK